MIEDALVRDAAAAGPGPGADIGLAARRRGAGLREVEVVSGRAADYERAAGGAR